MGFLLRTTGVPDCVQMTMSGWFRTPTPPDGDEDGHFLLQFGNQSGHDSAIIYEHYSSSYPAGVRDRIEIDFAGECFATQYYVWSMREMPGGTTLPFYFSEWDLGTPNAQNAAQAQLDLWNSTAIPPTHAEMNDPVLDNRYGFDTWYNTSRFRVFSNINTFTSSTWHHVLLSFDATGGMIDKTQIRNNPYGLSDQISTKACPFLLIIDGQNAIDYASQSPPWPTGKAIAQTYANSGSNTDPNGRDGVLSTGLPFYLPCNPAPTSLNPWNVDGSDHDRLESPLLKEYGTFQLWSNLFVDITNPTNFAKFVKIVGSQGLPEDPDKAAAAFGTQTILFRGKASDQSFYLNRGSGGPFGMNHSAEDFTPLPSYG